VIATVTGSVPTPIALPAVLVAVLIGVTVFDAVLATYTVLPLGVIPV
jgi:hypothetical protein